MTSTPPRFNQIRNMFGMFFMLVASIIGAPVVALSVADFNLPPQDADGWTILTPSADSRLVYVDSVSGDDSTGEIYYAGDATVGNDPRDPVGTVQAFQTLAAAYRQMRDDQPDWMLLRAGRVWENQSLTLRRGRSASERSVVSAYGEGARPELRTGVGKGIANRQASNVIVSGIKFWAHTRDPDGPYFESYEGTAGISLLAGEPWKNLPISDILLEGCFFRSYTNNVLTGGYDTNPIVERAPIVRFVMRRNIVSGNYSVDGHSQGLFYDAQLQPPTVPPSVLLEGNLFDHNGWRIQSQDGGSAKDKTDGQATMFNHNTYFAATRKVLFTGNIFARASSMANKFTANHGPDSSGSIVVENNLYVEGEIGISAGGNDPGWPLKFTDMHINNNVMTDLGRTRPTGRDIARYIGIKDWDGGEAKGNLILNQNAGLTKVRPMTIQAQHEMRNVAIEDNIVHNVEAGLYSQGLSMIRFEGGSLATNVNFANNTVQIVDGGLVAKIDALGGYSFSGVNGYYSNADAAKWFYTNGVQNDLEGWKSYTGDSGATVKAPNWPDADRDLERYVSELGLGTSFQDFIDALYTQSPTNWNPQFTAEVINDWFRAGFHPESVGGYVNVALGKPITADSDHSASAGAEAAVDGDSSSSDGTRWVSADTEWPHWLEIDLQGSYTIEELKFWTGSHNQYRNPIDYALQYWDGSQWITIVSESGNTDAIVHKTFPPVTTSFVRLNGTGGGDNLMRIFEVEIHGTPAVSNVALGKPILADSNHFASAGASAAVDGDSSASDSTRWVSTDTAWPHWLEIDLQGSYSINQLKFWTGSNDQYRRPIDYILQSWDGSQWVDILSRSGNTKAVVDESFPAVTASRLRLKGTGGSDNLMRIFEVEVYGF